MLLKKNCLISGIFLLFLFSCSTNNLKEKKTVFSKLDVTESGIGFNNIITENDSVNLISNEYTYMGGGVGIFDICNVSLCNRLTNHQLISFIVLKIFFVKK